MAGDSTRAAAISSLGDVLELEMATDPDPVYGRAMEQRPPSLGASWPP